MFAILLSPIFNERAVSLEREPRARQQDALKDIILTLPGVSPEQAEKRDAAKIDMLKQRSFREKLILDGPSKKFTGILSSEENFLDPKSHKDAFLPLNEFNRSPEIVTKPAIALLGPVLMVKNTADAARNVFILVEESVAKVKKNSTEKVVHLDPKKIHHEARIALDQLSEVEGVAVSIPGAEFAISAGDNDQPSSKYEVEDNVFTIDSISLEKTARGGFVSRIPSDAKDAYETKTLSFCSEKDAEGKTVALRIEEGCAETLAKVLAKWAKYSSLGFDFDRDTEEKVIKAVIKFIGIGTGDVLVRLEEAEMSSGVLEREIAKIIGEDEATMTKIAKFINPGKNPRSKR
jgi:hypothetical protein